MKPSIQAWLVLICALTLGGCAKVIVVPVAETPSPADGVIYALPNTVVRIQLKVDKVEKSVAPFMLYAPLFAPDGDPICKTPDCAGEKLRFAVRAGATF